MQYILEAGAAATVGLGRLGGVLGLGRYFGPNSWSILRFTREGLLLLIDVRLDLLDEPPCLCNSLLRIDLILVIQPGEERVVLGVRDRVLSSCATGSWLWLVGALQAG